MGDAAQLRLDRGDRVRIATSLAALAPSRRGSSRGASPIAPRLPSFRRALPPCHHTEGSANLPALCGGSASTGFRPTRRRSCAATPKAAARGEVRCPRPPPAAPKNGLKGLSIERRFSSPGTHPFDEVEWEIRDAVIGDPESPAFEQRGVEFPKSWSQNATNIVAQKYFRGQLGSDRARALGQTDDRPGRRDDLRLGARGRLLRLRRGRRRLRGGADLDPAQPEGGLQLAGLVQRRLRGAAAVLGLPAVPRAGLDARGHGPHRRASGGRAGRPRGLRLVRRDAHRRGEGQRAKARVCG